VILLWILSVAPPTMAEEPKDMTANEEKELRRVYDYLANFAPKHKLRKRMQPLLDRRYKIMQYKKNPDAIRIVDESGVELSSEHLEAELAHINTEVDSLQAQVAEIDADPTKKINSTDLMDALRALGKECTKVRGGAAVKRDIDSGILR
jgi:hypothetical protein